MPYVTAYLLVFLGFLIFQGVGIATDSLPANFAPFRVLIASAVVGGVGGCIYCLRGVYLNYSVKKKWSSEWHVWYFLRPVVSTCCGGISYLFLKAGLLVLESGTKTDASELGFYAFAFVAGFNVDKFIGKIEDIAQSIWGIERSRSSKHEEGKGNA